MLSRATEDADDEQQKSSRHDDDYGYMALVRRIVEQAQADRTHTCHRTHGCGDVCDIRETARQFLLDIRSGAAGLWSQWVDLASLSIGNERWLTDDQPDDPEPLPLFTTPPSPPPPVVPKRSSRERIEAYAKEKHLLTARQAAALTGFHYTVFMLHGRVHPAEKFLNAHLYRRSDLDRYMTTPAYASSLKRQAAMLRSRSVTSEQVVASGFAWTPQGLAEFRKYESKNIPAMAAG